MLEATGFNVGLNSTLFMAAVTMKPMEQAELRESLSRHNETFEGLLKLIPAKYYVVQDDQEVRGSSCTPVQAQQLIMLIV
jgi:hypothetical protein